jgi:hypothetical protein
MNADSRKYPSPPELMMPGSIADKAFKQLEPDRTHVFFANTSDKLFISSIMAFIPGINITSTTYLPADSPKDTWQSMLEGADKLVALLTPESMADVVLQQQIHAALDLSKDVILIHDQREANEFSEVLNVCPKELQDKGVFDHLAVALYGGDYQHISLQLLWQRLSLENSGGRKNSNLLSRNSVVVPLQPAFPQKSFLGPGSPQKSTNSVMPLPQPVSSQKAFAGPPLVASPTTEPEKQDEARLEELTAAEKNNVIAQEDSKDLAA